ncbi:MAG: tryptophan-rich sensory protein [Chlorobium sp.]|nr:MAG: tryptophan-rich sensory protein [Chlorobium sp.]
MKINYLKLFLCIGICFLFAFAGSTFTPVPGSDWYYHILKKPSWNPPDWLFPPAWTLLFLLMGTALYLVSEKPGNKMTAYAVFGVQLVLNLSWSATFFGLHSPAAALLVIVLLWLAILLCILKFREVTPAAAYLLVPYILWVSFASYLNFTIWRLN